jgi:hypothetical protein
MNTYEIEVMIGDKRRVTVEANSAAEALLKLSEGKYKTLGRSLERGFLTKGRPELKR